ncbi:MAG: epoxyqueuosine reductase QueH [Lentisphaerae bacterium]|nr:epoxyqueuosine reductase QueH [Lentisphaerota bacterium]
MDMPRLLLHTCCGPCATACIERLRDGYALTLFFSNSNIAPRAEYDRRLAAARKLADLQGLPLVEDAYDHAAWRAAVQGLEDEPERGRRCEACFAFNLGRAARYAREHAFDGFTTTLTVSPHKAAPVIFSIGSRLGPFLATDFKKQDGFKRSLELTRRLGLYRQDYCGCEFSARPPT